LPRLILFEFHLLGDAIMSLPFLNGARKKYDVYVCCSPGAARIYELVTPPDRLIVLEMPARRGPKFSLGAWVAYLKKLAQLRALRAQVGVTVWADVRVHLLMLFLGIPQRIGFPMNEVNYYAHELPVRKKKLETGEAIQRALRLLQIRALTTVLQRGSYRQHHVEDWQQIAQPLQIPWEIDPLWLDPGPAPAAAADFLVRQAGRKIWFLHPGAGKEIRRWPHFELMVRQLFAPRNVPLIILDDPGSPRIDIEYENCLHWPMGTLADFFALAARCDYLLCNDTAAAHVGTALRKHVVTIFGPGSSDWFAPYTRERTVIESHACPYRPCLDNCVQPTLVCLNDVTPERVAGQLEKLLS
jgi:ADP-heptose:LPS heptosyltransferase